MSAGQELTVTPQQQTRELIYSRADQFAKAWGSENKAERFMLAAINAIGSDEKLMSCTALSKMSCLMQLCQWQLMLGKSIGHVFLVPFYNKAVKARECTILIGYKGYCNLAYRSGLPSWIQSRVVYENDFFEYTLGSEPKLDFRPAEKERGKRRGVYLVIQFKGGSKFIDFMTAEEIAPVKAFALSHKGDGFSPWQGDFEDEMWCKSIIRRDAKRLALGEIFEQAASYESEIETQIADSQEPALPYPRKAVMQNASTLQSAEGVVTDVTVETKRDRKNKKDLELYTVTLHNGSTYATFDAAIGREAMNLKDTGETALLEFQNDNYGARLLSIAELAPAEPDTWGLEYSDTLE